MCESTGRLFLLFLLHVPHLDLLRYFCVYIQTKFDGFDTGSAIEMYQHELWDRSSYGGSSSGYRRSTVAPEVVVLFNRDWSDSTRLLASLSMSPLPDMPTLMHFA